MTDICLLPSMAVVFRCFNLAEGAAVLHHVAVGGAEGQALGPQPAVLELRLESFGPPATGPAAGIPEAERPHLAALLSDGTLLLYKAAPVRVRCLSTSYHTRTRVRSLFLSLVSFPFVYACYPDSKVRALPADSRV